MKSIDSEMFVKIEFYKGYHVDDVIYYIERIPLDLAIKYRWYFEYLTALIKTRYPHNRVRLIIGKQDLPTKEEYTAKKIKTLLSHKKGQLAALKSFPTGDDDMFGFDAELRNNKMNRIEKEIEELEKGHIIFWIPYVDGGKINKIKSYLK